MPETTNRIVITGAAGLVGQNLVTLLLEEGYRNIVKPLHSEIATFAMVNVLAMVHTHAVTLMLAYYLLPWMGIQHHSETIAHLVVWRSRS